jgi:hypothetical protein
MNTQARAVSQLGMDSKALEALKTPYEIIEQEKSDRHNNSPA